jgi:DNA-directed RNA polymerase specialized sigma24 family protein
MGSHFNHQRAHFRTTQWSLVAMASQRRASGEPDADQSRQALEQLCHSYWYPIYSFVRRSGSDRDSAEDLTQGFFTRLLEKDFLAEADPARGRFRTFLLAALKHYLSSQREHAEAIKRGGQVRHWSLNFDDAESRYIVEPTDGWTAEAIFIRSWAITLLRDVLTALESEYESNGKVELFTALRPYLTGQPSEESLVQIADRLSTTPGALKVAAHRLRSTYRDRLVSAVAATVGEDEDVNAERKLLLDAIAGRSTSR